MDLRWLAGFIDGEGSIGIRVCKRPRDSRITSTASCLRLSQAAPRDWILDELVLVFGGIIQNKHTKNPNHNKAREWVLTGLACKNLMEQLLPFLILKKRHAEIILEHESTKDRARIGTRKGTPRDSYRIPDEIILLREHHINELRQLNARGSKVRSGQITRASLQHSCS